MIGRSERILGYAILIVFSIVVLVPVVMLLLTALSPMANGQITISDLQFGNFADAWQQSDFGSHVMLSVVLALTVTAATVVITPLAAYGIGILRIPGHRLLFFLFIAGIMIPLEGILVPLYFTMRTLPFASTIGALIVAQIGLSVSFGVFWMRAAMTAIPSSLLESGSLDGAGSFRTLWSIVLPLVLPALTTLALLTFMWVWNDYFLAFVLINNPDQLPVTVTLGDFTTKYSTQINLMSACAVLVALPVVILYLAFQRQFISGILSGALKG